jgi:2-amino-4-hydroxy-6-hydroxymethyldihydropteridine diphosphokinase
MKILSLSSVYETEPMYVRDQGWFLNCVVAVETDSKPASLLSWLKHTEKKIGRRDAPKNAPRIIDMDLLVYGDKVLSAANMTVPHPRMAERAFVLIPLDEIRPRLIHPVTGKTASEMLKSLGVHEKVVKVPGALADLSTSPLQRPSRPGRSPSRRGSGRGVRRSSPR